MYIFFSSSLENGWCIRSIFVGENGTVYARLMPIKCVVNKPYSFKICARNSWKAVSYWHHAPCKLKHVFSIFFIYKLSVHAVHLIYVTDCHLRFFISWYISCCMEFHVNVSEFLFTVNIILIHFYSTGAASVAGSWNISERFCYKLFALFTCRFLN